MLILALFWLGHGGSHWQDAALSELRDMRQLEPKLRTAEAERSSLAAEVESLARQLHAQEALSERARQQVDTKDGARMLALRSLQINKDETEARLSRAKADADDLRAELRSTQASLSEAERARKAAADSLKRIQKSSAALSQ